MSIFNSIRFVKNISYEDINENERSYNNRK